MTNAPDDKFEREKWELECRFRERELTIKEREQDLRNQESARSRWSNPLVLAVLATATGALVNIGVVWYNGQQQRDLEDSKAITDRTLEDQKAESVRILELIKSGDPEVNANNFQFLLDTKLVKIEPIASDLRHWLSTRKRGEGPSTGQTQYITPSFECGVEIENGSRIQVEDVAKNVVSTLQGTALNAVDITLAKTGDNAHINGTIKYALPDKKTLKAMIGVNISKQAPWVMQIEGSSADVAGAPATFLVEGFIDGLVIDQTTGSIAAPDLKTKAIFGSQIGNIIQDSACSADRWH